MSAPNFNTKNAKCIYAIMQDDFNFIDDLRENVKLDDWKEEKGWDRANDAERICSRRVYKSLSGIFVDLEVRIYMRPGYYEGAVLDYDIFYSNYNNTLTECRGDINEFADEIAIDIEDDLKERKGWTAGLIAINHHKIRKVVEETIGTARECAEDFCKAYADELLTCVGIASNGEAFYQRAK